MLFSCVLIAASLLIWSFIWRCLWLVHWWWCWCCFHIFTLFIVVNYLTDFTENWVFFYSFLCVLSISHFYFVIAAVDVFIYVFDSSLLLLFLWCLWYSILKCVYFVIYTQAFSILSTQNVFVPQNREFVAKQHLIIQLKTNERYQDTQNTLFSRLPFISFRSVWYRSSLFFSEDCANCLVLHLVCIRLFWYLVLKLEVFKRKC